LWWEVSIVVGVLLDRASWVRLPFSVGENIRNPTPLARLTQKAGVLAIHSYVVEPIAIAPNFGNEPRILILHPARLAELEVPAE